MNSRAVACAATAITGLGVLGAGCLRYLATLDDGVAMATLGASLLLLVAGIFQLLGARPFRGRPGLWLIASTRSWLLVLPALVVLPYLLALDVAGTTAGMLDVVVTAAVALAAIAKADAGRRFPRVD
jgi:hypothetical protein